MSAGLDLDTVRRKLAAAPDAGRTRPLKLGRLVEGDDALGRLPEVVTELCAPGSPVAVLAAATPLQAQGQDLRQLISDLLSSRFALQWCIVGPSGQDDLVHADEATLAAATAAARGAACVITVGSGTITDIGKAAAGSGAALVCVQTATSVNGYADPFSVLLRDGVKRTTPTRWPDALLIDTTVLAAAPADLNRAGLGDELAMFTASADWYLASVLGQPATAGLGPDGGGVSPAGSDPLWHSAVAWLTRSQGGELIELASKLGRADGLAALARILTLSGIAMGVAGSTAPASGMEHAISHLLEMVATARGEPASFHGAQVGVASVVAAVTWQHVRDWIAEHGLDRPACLPGPDDVRDQIQRAFAALDPSGAMAAECFADYARKLRRLAARDDPLDQLRTGWQQHEAALVTLLAGPAEIAAALRTAGLPVTFAELAGPVGDDTARWALGACGLQRQRIGVADLAMLLGCWRDDDIDKVLAGSAVLGNVGAPDEPTPGGPL
jgi:glycerol-1-phosphate dehydrogenase [NAD(P)+]